MVSPRKKAAEKRAKTKAKNKSYYTYGHEGNIEKWPSIFRLTATSVTSSQKLSFLPVLFWQQFF
jgi:hypothetical protein